MANNNDLPLAIDSGPIPPLPPARSGGARRWLPVLALLLVLLGGTGWYFWQMENTTSSRQVSGRTDVQAPPDVPAPSQHGPQVSLSQEQNNIQSGQAGEQQERKQAFGLEQSLDVVVRSDESIVINDTVVSMAEIQRQLNRYRGQLSEQNLNPALEQLSAWGVYLVRPGDNLWRIHLNLLREYLGGRGVELALGADQPKPSGYSSGVGKILKFAEHMVGVYNVKTGQISHDLNLLEPGEKAVVFNLSEIFAQIKDLKPSQLDGVMYDGRVLIFPGRLN